MDNLEEAKKIMQAAGCIKAFPIYDLRIENIAEIKGCHEKGESLELIRDIHKLVPAYSQDMIINIEKPIACPIDPSFNKYLEFSLKNKSINTCNLNTTEYNQIEGKITFLLNKYNWVMKK